MDYEIEHPDIGIIRYIKNNRAKRIVISVKPDFVRVTVPRRQTLKNAQKFVEQKIDWIKTHSKNMQLLRKKSYRFIQHQVFSWHDDNTLTILMLSIIYLSHIT